ncbi:nose resistant to fluoxetine protein 6-like [Sitodiplosis mosellana]|uniref:nose resistant to fluoxetine protein 6-like n=1 Tax=Sitodiplosis mosellana TaxID=263140 RepID=UPI002444783C|nr:nose resistant to fluoxetine protein 6-like [Sitodiplosis mosellana]
MIRVELVILFLLLVICQWQVECGNKTGTDWSILYQRVLTLQFGLIYNKNLDKYVNLSEHSTNDNKALIDDRTKVKRSYNTKQCIKDLRTIQEAFNDRKSNWANEMLGAWGKMPPVGFNKDFGNFDRCHDLQMNKSINIETQYCLAEIDSTKSNVGYITPEWLQVGMCLPNSCAPSLIATILNDYLDANKMIQINIRASLCRFKNDNSTLFFSYKLFIAFLTMVLGLVILSSIYDVTFTVRDEPKNPLLLAFSAYTNGKNLFACKSNQSPNVMPFLDGIRAIAALLVVSAHFDWFGLEAVVNTGPYASVAAQLKRIFVSGRFSVDTFFVLSALLAANKMLNEHSKNGRLNIPVLYLQRMLRLSPVLTVVALFYRFFLQFCANGPAYSLYLDPKRKNCENSMWDSILYFDNLRMKQCVLGSWYLAADMHLYLLTPFLVLLLQRHPKRFMAFSSVFISIDFILSLDKKLFGLDGYDSHFTTQSHITPWLIGVIFAYILLRMRSTTPIRLPKLLNILLLTGSVSVFPLLTYAIGHVDDIFWKGRVWWSLSVSYIIFACVNGQGGIINWLLSLPRWQPISRLSYNLYLIHIPVIAIIHANRQVPWYFSSLTQVHDLFLVASTSCAAAVVLALTIEMPVINLSHIFLYKNKNKARS